MRARDLDAHYTVVHRTILRHQDPVTGLLPAHQIGRPCYPPTMLHPGYTLPWPVSFYDLNLIPCNTNTVAGCWVC